MNRGLFAVSVHVLFVRGNEVLLIRRRGTGFADGMYSVPAGHVTAAETISEAAAREAEEEVGLNVAPNDLVVTGVMQRWSVEPRVDFFVKANRWTGEPINREPHKCDDVAWFGLGWLPANIVAYVRVALERGTDGLWFEQRQRGQDGLAT